MRRPAKARTSRPSSARSTRSSRRFLAEGPTRAELERVKTEIRSCVHPRRRASRRLRAASRTSSPRTPSTAAGPTTTSTRSRVLNGATQQQVLAHGAQVDSRRAARDRGPPVPRGARGERHERGPLDSCRCRRRFPTAPFPALQQATLANGMRLIVAERHAVPVVQFSLQLNAGLRGRSVRGPRRRDDDDGDARRRHGDDGRARDQRRARGPRRRASRRARISTSRSSACRR